MIKNKRFATARFRTGKVNTLFKFQILFKSSNSNSTINTRRLLFAFF